MMSDADPAKDPDGLEPQSGLGGYKHEIAHPSEWPWLPRGDGKGMDRHPYDPQSGLVMYVGDDRALKAGALVNLIARLRKAVARDGRKIADVQQRLILQRLREMEADDPFGLKLARQLGMVHEAVHAVCGFDHGYLEGKLVEVVEHMGRDGNVVREGGP